MKTPDKVTLRKLLHYANVFELDIDVAVDSFERLWLGCCFYLTQEGEKRFGPALDGCHVAPKRVIVPPAGQGHLAHLAEELLTSLCGRCTDEEFNAWFAGDDAELI